jgi:hypothetical protein
LALESANLVAVDLPLDAAGYAIYGTDTKSTGSIFKSSYRPILPFIARDRRLFSNCPEIAKRQPHISN